MHAAVFTSLLVTATLGQPRPYSPDSLRPSAIKKDELEYQKQAFKQWWGNDLVVKLDDLPLEGVVPEFRVPYSGHDYPDLSGGTVGALLKYDQAFHGGRPLAAEFERMDIREHRNGEPDSVRGLFGRLRQVRRRTPTWYGHCNGWTAAAIRHAEPQNPVVRNGVTFTPADIKGLLAEIYMYTDSEFLGGVDPAINPGTLHLVLANWLGRGSHPVGMETAVGEVVVNFPIYSYRAVVNRLGPQQAEVRMSIRYALNVNRETDKSPRDYNRQMYFHYALDLDDEGAIRGGHYFGDSQQIDMLWTPLKPAQGGQEKNLRGNPHLDVKEVLAIWRESVPEELRKKWLNIDPPEEDRVELPSEALVRAESSARSSPRETSESVGGAGSQPRTEAAVREGTAAP
jgi:hypothetical protein